MPGSVTVHHNQLEYAAQVAEQAVQTGGYASAVLAVANHAETIWQHVVPGRDQVHWRTLFPIASITKPITVTAIMQLVERGRLTLSDPVADHIPEFAQNGKDQVTVWHLLTHTSGLDEPTEEALDRLYEQRAPLQAYLELAYGQGLRSEPGSQWSYGMITFSILGELITRLGGQPHPEYMQTHLFDPLQMTDTAFRPTDAERTTPAPGPEQPPDVWEYHYSLAFPAGGLYSTASDLIRFGQMMLNGGRLGATRVISQAALATMTRVHTQGIMSIENGKPRPTFQGLGWGMRSPFGNVMGSERAYGHAGATGSWLWIDPEWDLVFALVSNSHGTKLNIPINMLNAIYGALERAHND